VKKRDTVKEKALPVHHLFLGETATWETLLPAKATGPDSWPV